MIGISKLYCGTVEPSDPLRYGRETDRLPSHLLQFSRDKRPVVVWNLTQRCNLSCAHCYSKSDWDCRTSELSAHQAKGLLKDLAQFGCPVVLFSGGEPLLREDIFELIQYSSGLGLRTGLSTNGTLITSQTARMLRDCGVAYVGVSLDGVAQVHDGFRGSKGAFDRALTGIRRCMEEGIKVGVRLTLHKGNVSQIEPIMELVDREGIQRVCFYHLVYSGRAEGLKEQALTHQQTRHALDTILNITRSLHVREKPVEVLTVDNHADGPYIVLRLLKEDTKRAREVLELLRMNGGNRSGEAIACIGWDGEVYPDQFWRTRSVGNVLKRPFSDIWASGDAPLLRALRERKSHLKGRCAQCVWLDVCNGNMRVRAEALTGDMWAPDPACYMADDEIREIGDLSIK
jgi:12,18-didecarboxysiroheme deacetylase